MFCPVCESEYEAGITRCPDDGAELVEKLPQEKSARDQSEARFIPLHAFGSPAEAEMVADILQKNEVRAVVKAGGADAFAPLLSTTAQGSVVLVDERDLDRAREVYYAFFGEDETPLTGESEGDWK
ncbi:MAG: hypothetical protein C4334_04170 [Pyrinomonas sp.]|uniref:putative signal transducing protein n=1 Tax=Pyrinomonas sp. TaxID=2080306 RepID=UPI00332315D1